MHQLSHGATEGISVIIPARNEQDTIQHCLRFFLKQTYKGPFEIIVIDNESNDQTIERVEAFAKRYPRLHIRAVREFRKGTARACQTGVEVSRYAIAARTDSDTEVFPDWLERIGSTFRNPRIVAVGGRVYYEHNIFFTMIVSWLRILHSCFILHFFGANLAVRTSALEKIGGFDTQLPSSEDFDLSVRLQKEFGTDALVFDKKIRVRTSLRKFRRGMRTIRALTTSAGQHCKLWWRYELRFEHS